MKKLKVFWMGKPLKDVYPHATKWQVMKWKVSEFFKACVRFTAKVTFFSGIGYGLFSAGAYFNPVMMYANSEVVVEKVVSTDAPIMDKIAGCESVGSPKSKGIHFDKNGQVLVRGNTNRTVDVGRYQINSVWFGKATELGLDVFKEEDNKKMAYWIYHNYGSEPWYSSAKCWR